tara:strand:+ start:3385 stop:5676 length:2292 start_codon:yes stop_codon:yes gene_type:complete
MKPQAKQHSVQSQGISTSVKFGIKKSGLAHILGVLRNQLYSDKILAVVREYTCNAVDAHAEKGCVERPIEVTLPNRLDPYFKVRDFGVSLSEKDIQDVYAFYGESTKRNTNDQIGMLGIGSKAAFAYGDNFVINSYIDGKKHIYNAYIDESQVGQISKVGEENSKEETGIEIVVSVKEDDTDEFVEKAKGLFKYFPVKPIIKGADETLFEYKDSSDVLFSGDGWEWHKSKYSDRYGHRSGDAVVVMGNIGYPIEERSLNLNYEDKHELYILLKDNLVLFAEIGELEISASREKLQYTDFTRNALIEKLKKVSEGVVAEAKKEFSECKTLFEAKCLYGSIMDFTSGLYDLRGILAKNLDFKGVKIGDSDFSAYSPDSDKRIQCHKFTKGYRSSKYRPEECHNINCTKDTVVVVNDVGHRRGIMGKMLPLIINQGKTPFVLQFESDKAKKQWIKSTRFDGELVLLSSLPSHKLAEFGYAKSSAGASGSAGVKNSKHSKTAFNLDWDKVDESRRHYSVTKSSYYSCVEGGVDVDEEEGIYVVIDKFAIKGLPEDDDSDADWKWRGEVCPSYMGEVKDALDAMKIKLPKVYAFKVKVAPNVEGKKNWVSLWTWLKKQMKESIVSQNLEQKYVDRVKALSVSEKREWTNLNDAGGKQLARVADKVISPDSDFKKFFDARESMLNNTQAKEIDVIRVFANGIGIKFNNLNAKPSYDLPKMIKRVAEKYSMIEMVDSYKWQWGLDRNGVNGVDILVNYINVIDVCEHSKD